MNERIKELVDQSDLHWLIDDAYLDRDDWQPFVQKFAELIIKECIEINKQELSFNAFERLMNKYREHFGVI